MPPPEPIRHLLLACEGMPFRVENLDAFSHHLVRVSDDRRSFLAGGGVLQVYPLNPAVAVAVAQDKAHAYAVLRRAGLPVPVGEHFFLSPHYIGARPPGRELADAVLYAEAAGYPRFVKPNTASRGAYAAVVHDRTALLYHLVEMGGRHLIGLVQEVLIGQEYRVFVVDGKVRFAHRKLPAVLTGDGIRTVAELADALDTVLIRNGLPPLDRAYAARRLAERGLAWSSVPPLGKGVPVEARGNLSLGGCPADLMETVPSAADRICCTAAESLGLRVAGIDLMVSTGLDDPDGQTIIEVNGNPGLTALERLGRSDLIRTLWCDILNRYFERG